MSQALKYTCWITLVLAILLEDSDKEMDGQEKKKMQTTNTQTVMV